VRTVTGQQVAATTGDFSLSADNVSLNLGEFETTGSVAIGNVGGTAYATVSAGVTLGTQAAGGTVNVSGSFQSNGDFAFDGSGALELAGNGGVARVVTAIEEREIASSLSPFASMTSISRPSRRAGSIGSAGFAFLRSLISVSTLAQSRSGTGLLVCSHRHQVRFDDQDVRRLQDRVGE
jgi:hypothetical protein